MVYMIHGITDCPACLRAEALLMEKELEYVVVVADFSKTYRDAIREELKWPTFPLIVLVRDNNKTLIGGLEALQAHLKGS